MKRGESIRLAGAIFIAVALLLLMPCLSFAGSLEPSDPPGPTMKTLDQIPPTWSQRLPASERFQGVFEYEDVCYIGGHPYPCTKYHAVLDKETGLVWQKDLNPNPMDWYSAELYCTRELSLGGRAGWRLPTVQELASLIDSGQAIPNQCASPALPIGHPFTNVQIMYWANPRTLGGYTDRAWHVFLCNPTGGATVEGMHNPYSNVWCVRGVQGVNIP